VLVCHSCGLGAVTGDKTGWSSVTALDSIIRDTIAGEGPPEDPVTGYIMWLKEVLWSGTKMDQMCGKAPIFPCKTGGRPADLLTNQTV
jgi:hypothetical protein